MREMVGGCCVCSDDRGWSENPLVYCDGQSCTVAVHQACYGIVSVPTGPWFCRKCESQERSAKVKCELCPSRYGALKRTDTPGGWAHVVCALYIPEVRFGNVTTMEPIQLQLIPGERFNKVCYICEEKGKPANAAIGACMQCNKIGCKQQFHVTCAQGLGLLCEEAGNYLDNVKYCGYCQHHYSKLKKGGNVKTIPPYKPVSSTENQLSDSSSEKEADGSGGGPVATKSVPTTAGGAQSGHSGGGKRKSSGNANKEKSTTTSAANAKTSASFVKATSGTTTGGSTTPAGGNSSSGSSKAVNSLGLGSKNEKSSKNTNSSARGSASAKNVPEDANTNHSISDNSNDLTGRTSDKSKTAAGSGGGGDVNEFETTKETTVISTGGGGKGSKKRRTNNSRTPTPVNSSASGASESVLAQPATEVADKKDSGGASHSTETSHVDKSKKLKIDTTQAILSNQPVVALTSISTIKATNFATLAAASSAALVSASVDSSPANAAEATSSQTATTSPSTALTTATPHHHQQVIQTTPTTVNSLVVSVPLSSTALSPHPHLATGASSTGGNHASVLTNAAAIIGIQQEHKIGVLDTGILGSHLNSLDSLYSLEGMIGSDTGGGGLKITYEKQEGMNTEIDMDIEDIQVPAKRTRSQSGEKTEKIVTSHATGRGKKRNASANGLNAQLSNSMSSMSSSAGVGIGVSRRSNSRAQRSTTPPVGAFASVSQHQEQPQPPSAAAALAKEPAKEIKDSPPSSPSSESQQGTTSNSRGGRGKSRKSAPASLSGGNSNAHGSKDVKDVKLFQNGVVAPHMLGNQLNPNSNMAQKMTDHLNSELEAHSIFIPNENNANLMGPQLHHRVIASARANSTGGSSTASGASAGSGISSMLGGGGGTIPQTLEQLLERQWEQGSQFLMEQAQHFDIASLLCCLHQLRVENLRLEEHVSSLLQRRDHLLAVNARLAIPLTGQPATPQSSHPHTVNNIHPAVAASHGDIPRNSRHSSNGGAGAANYPAHPQGSSSGGSSTSSIPMENGLPPDPNSSSAYPQQPPHSHRSPAPGQPPQRSPTLRW